LQQPSVSIALRLNHLLVDFRLLPTIPSVLPCPWGLRRLIVKVTRGSLII
jgi:hypothetical protein